MIHIDPVVLIYENRYQKVRDARFFAMAAHAAIGQNRKWTEEPYIVHPCAVVHTLSRLDVSPDVLAAAWMHDVIEDTAVTEEQMRLCFPGEIVNLVMMVTDVSKPEDGNRRERKAKDLEHFVTFATPDAWLIRLADFQDNLRTIIPNAPKFAKVCCQEMRLALDAMVHIKLGRAGCRELRDNVERTVDEFLATQ